MKTIEIPGDIDDRHHLHAQVPEGFPVGSVRVILLAPEEDEAGAAWTEGVASEWSEDLADRRQDIYTLEDGEPVDAPR